MSAVLRRTLTALAGVVLLVDAWLWLSGRISGPVALAALIVVEVTLCGIFLALSVRRARHRGVSLLDQVPPLRWFVWEASTWGDLFRALRGTVLVPPGAVALPARRGMWQLPVMFTVVIIIEIIAVELLLPWLWLRVGLLVLSLYFLPLLWGIVAGRAVHPHYLAASELVLRSGRTVIARIPRGTIRAVRRARHFDTGQRAITGDMLSLGGPEGSNVRLLLNKPVAAEHDRWPWQGRRMSPVREVRLWLDEPGRLLDVLDPSGVRPR